MAGVRSIDLGGVFLESLDGVCELVLVRHGEQEFQPRKPLSYGTDAPLTDLGRRQADAIGERLAGWTIDAVHSSPMQRAHDTGRAIAGHHDLDVTLHPTLQEVDLWGALDQDRPLIDAVGGEDELLPILREANRTRRWDAYPHGEDRAGFRSRVVTTLESIAAAHDGDRVVVTCHGGVINAYLAHLWGSDLDQLVTVHHTSISTVRVSGDHRRVVQVNDYAHVLPFQSGLDPMNAA